MENNLKKQLTDVALRTKRGYLSTATNSFQFGILEKHQWVGEERLLRLNDEPAGYSIVAKTKMRTFAISKEDAQKKFTKEITSYIKSIVEQRYQWILGRARSLIHSSMNVAKMDPSCINYDQNLTEQTKRFPSATTYVLTNIRKKSIITTINKGLLKQRIEVCTANKTARNTAESTFRSTCYEGKILPNISSRISSPKGAFHFLSEQKDIMDTSKKSKIMSIAASAPKFAFRDVLTPVLNSGHNVVSGVRCRRSSVVEEKDDMWDINNELRTKEFSNFGIGKRTISLIDSAIEKRPKTPNPFGKLRRNFRNIEKR